jgi:hypothetical protein
MCDCLKKQIIHEGHEEHEETQKRIGQVGLNLDEQRVFSHGRTRNFTEKMQKERLPQCLYSV